MMNTEIDLAYANCQTQLTSLLIQAKMIEGVDKLGRRYKFVDGQRVEVGDEDTDEQFSQGMTERRGKVQDLKDKVKSYMDRKRQVEKSLEQEQQTLDKETTSLKSKMDTLSDSDKSNLQKITDEIAKKFSEVTEPSLDEMIKVTDEVGDSFSKASESSDLSSELQGFLKSSADLYKKQVSLFKKGYEVKNKFQKESAILNKEINNNKDILSKEDMREIRKIANTETLTDTAHDVADQVKPILDRIGNKMKEVASDPLGTLKSVLDKGGKATSRENLKKIDDAIKTFAGDIDRNLKKLSENTNKTYQEKVQPHVDKAIASSMEELKTSDVAKEIMDKRGKLPKGPLIDILATLLEGMMHGIEKMVEADSGKDVKSLKDLGDTVAEGAKELAKQAAQEEGKFLKQQGKNIGKTLQETGSKIIKKLGDTPEAKEWGKTQDEAKEEQKAQAKLDAFMEKASKQYDNTFSNDDFWG
jgi:adenosyl cobinamide kinase/adenosyl cobinamide phosphate guanylyltransferase